MTDLKTYNIIIIDPSVVIQQGLKHVFESNAGFKIIANYSDLESFLHTKKDSIHAILVNPSLISFYKQFSIKSVLSEYTTIPIIGILYTYVDAETIASFDGILDIYDDASTISKKLKKIIESTNLEETNNSSDIDLSDREKEILVAVAKGLTNKEIADKHFISIHTVISHRKNITRKTGIKTVSGLTMYALFNNLLSQEDL